MAPPRRRWGSAPQKPCRSFNMDGTCRFGASCKFKHEKGSRSALQQKRAADPVGDDKDDVESKMLYSRFKRLIKRSPAHVGPEVIREVWASALLILDTSDKQDRQNLARDIVDEQRTHGYQYLVHTTSLTPGATSPSTLGEVVEPFFRVIAHQELLYCISIDTYVGDMYNFLCGSGGNRFVPFCKNVIESLVTSESLVSTSLSPSDLLVALGTSLQEVLKRNPRAAYNDGLGDLIESLSNIPRALGLPDSSVAAATVAHRVAELRRLHARARGTLAGEEPRLESVPQLAMSTYPRQVDLPSGKHDNDKADIASICVMPTEDELRCDKPAYLPGASSNEPSLVQGLDRLLDRNFRLYRQDAIGEMNTCLKSVMEACEESPALSHSITAPSDGVRAHVYHGVQVRNAWFDDKAGFEFVLAFLQPLQVRKKAPEEQQRWWQETERLEEGGFLCLLVFSDERYHPVFLNVSRKSTDPKDKHGLVSGRMGCITVNVLRSEDKTRAESQIRSLLVASTQPASHVLIEFPTIIPQTFVPILENLQKMQSSSQLPFYEWLDQSNIASEDGTTPTTVKVPPPLYARNAGFGFDLAPILRSGSPGLTFYPTSSDVAETVALLQARSSLDHGQSEALVAALNHELVLSQGPPGCGKSFLGVQLMRILVHNKARARLGPILVICYTNHALDQFLEHLIDEGIEKVIRIGGASKSTRLDGKNLRVIAKTEGKTARESYMVAKSFDKTTSAGHIIKSKFKSLHKVAADWEGLKHFLERKHPRIHSQFSRIDEEGFKVVGKLEPFDLWIRGQDKRAQATADSGGNIAVMLARARSNVYSLPIPDRMKLAEHWVERHAQELLDSILDAKGEYDEALTERNNIHDEADRRILETADVIGCTTTGMARRISVLRRMTSKVVVCEEAAEVIEAHMLSALVPRIEHAIQIGDHQQLRPQISDYNLSVESTRGRQFRLDVSQFERLSTGGNGRPPFPVAQLNIQRRMRPEISRLIRSTQYPRLEDHESVFDLPNVVGMRQNLFWLDHQNMEDGSRSEAVQQSKSNDWEVTMVHALVRHLVRQGAYETKDIALLTPYTGQLQKLRKRLGSDFEVVLSDRDVDQLNKEGHDTDASLPNVGRPSTGQQSTGQGPSLKKTALNQLLRIATVDNYQGEEAKIVIVSLVRSNKDKRVGFLRTENRINVLLSRAQHGMFIIGNAETYSNIPMWETVLGMLRQDDLVGPEFALCCPRHPDTPINCAQPEDFTSLSPEGGCRLMCDKRLLCGHKCRAKCHSDALHRTWSCPERCPRLHDPCGHSCPKSCGEACGPCNTKVKGVRLPCGHTKDNVKCNVSRRPETIRCTVAVTKTIPGCGHEVVVQCCEDTTSPSFGCPATCGAILACGHSCAGHCGDCSKVKASKDRVGDHVQCGVVCGRPFSTCTHTCAKTCHRTEPCGICEASCEVHCKHSRCGKPCSDACSPCIQKCAWSCEHQGACSMPCSAPCNRLPCDLRCTQRLDCGHQCPSLCGEDCPSTAYCQLCCDDDKKAHQVDMLELRVFAQIDLDQTPIVVLSCGHFYTSETLDGHMQMAEVYTTDAEGRYTGLRDDSALSEHPPKCPQCKRAIQQFSTQRYNRSINRSVMDEISKRFIVSGTARISDLDKGIDLLDQQLRNARLPIVQARSDGPSGSNAAALKTCEKREKDLTGLYRRVENLIETVSNGSQPARKLHDATVLASSRDQQPLESQLSSLSLAAAAANSTPASPLDSRVVLGAGRLRVKTLYARLAHRADLAHRLGTRLSDADLAHASALLGLCATLAADCTAAHLPRLAVEAALYHGGTTGLLPAASRGPYLDAATSLLAGARRTCMDGDARFAHAAELLRAVDARPPRACVASGTRLSPTPSATPSGPPWSPAQAASPRTPATGTTVATDTPLQSASAACPWSWPGVPSAASRWAGGTMRPSRG
jgi:hypothetical protein